MVIVSVISITDIIFKQFSGRLQDYFHTLTILRSAGPIFVLDITLATLAYF